MQEKPLWMLSFLILTEVMTISQLLIQHWKSPSPWVETYIKTHEKEAEVEAEVEEVKFNKQQSVSSTGVTGISE